MSFQPVCRLNRQIYTFVILLSCMLSNNLTETIKHIFLTLGLTQDHSDTYLTLLGEGLATTTKLSKYSDIPRTTHYSILEDLIDWNLVKKEQDGNRTLYSCTEPYNLLNAVVTHKNNCDELAYILKRELYQLENIYNSKLEQKQIEKFDIDRLDSEFITKMLITSNIIRCIINTDDNNLLSLISEVYEKIEDICDIKELILKSTDSYLRNNKLNNMINNRIVATDNSRLPIDHIKILSENVVITINRSYYKIDDDFDFINSEIMQFDLFFNSK